MLSKSKEIILIVTIFLTIGNCGNDPIIVNKMQDAITFASSLISPDQKGIKAFVGYSYPELGIESAANARVLLKEGDNYLVLTHDSCGLYQNLSFKALSGHVYDLVVTLPTGKIINSKTKIPGEITIRNFSRGDTLFYLKKPITPNIIQALGPQICWQGGVGAATFICFYQFVDTLDSIKSLNITTQDTFANAPGLTFYQGKNLNSGLNSVFKANLVVCAIDTNFCKNAKNFYNDRDLGNVPFINDKNPLEIPFPNFSDQQMEEIVNGMVIFGSYTYTLIDVVIAVLD